ncbi:MAG: MarR family transcriptional regulator [Candidatus Eremiobacteraeota bacterium]|nr:MarR family transcriptional regulator [Candidatus Eremiobacteraeota bacterium]MCW5869912.1 MarR family transcriptional regulator [Candidatus Eremiobacteraeota bacterium]
MLAELLEALRVRPRTRNELLLLLQASPGQLEAALFQLSRGGYVDRAIPEQGSCHSGCGHCSVKNFCPGESAEETWRLTDKALSRVAPPA